MRAMKDSGIPWIGKIPEEWNINTAFQLFTLVKNKNEGLQEKNLLSLSYGKIKRKSIDTVGGLLPESFDGYNIIEKDDIVLRLTDLQNDQRSLRVGLSPERGIVTSAYLTLRNRSASLPEYLYYFLHAYDISKGFYGMGAGVRQGLNWEGIKWLQILSPSVEEQKRIIDCLDTECARIDAVMEQTRASIEEYKKLKQSVITQAVTKGIRPNRPMKDSGIDWIGQIPAEWEVYRIANLYDERNESGQEDLPILSVSINTGISDHEVADEEQTRVFVRSEDKTKYKRVYPGDLAYNMMRAWQGAFGAVRVDGMVSPAYVVAKPKQGIKLDSRFMEALLRTPAAIEEMHRYSRGITDFRLRLYWPEFKNIRVCIPSETEQNEIADFIDEKSMEFDALIAKKEHFLSEMESYKKSLIFEYVTGKKEVV